MIRQIGSLKESARKVSSRKGEEGWAGGEWSSEEIKRKKKRGGRGKQGKTAGG